MKPLIVIFFAISIFLVAGPRTVCAAEIININYKYKIAFTDLTQRDVRDGDLVDVVTSDGKRIKLKVLEAFPVMSKLSAPDGELLTEQQFSAIAVGNQVVAEKGVPARPAVVFPVQENGVAPDVRGDDGLAHVEKYSPGEGTVNEKPAAVIESSGQQLVEPADMRARAAVLEQRLDQVMGNNVKLTETITQLLTDKNAVEAQLRAREADVMTARKRANEFSDANAELRERIQALEDAAASFEQVKAAQQKEIENLNVKLGELRKKLAKMVEIVNTNMKAYEK